MEKLENVEDSKVTAEEEPKTKEDVFYLELRTIFSDHAHVPPWSKGEIVFVVDCKKEVLKLMKKRNINLNG